MILFIRHGESLFNRLCLHQGRMDNPLTDNGLRQAQIASQRLKNAKIDIIYASPLTRTKVTAEKINKYHHIPIIYDDRIIEIDKGVLAGKPRNNPFSAEFKKDPHKFGGETKEDVYNRAIEFFKEIENSNKNILIVSHSGIFEAIYTYLNDLPIGADTRILENCGMYVCRKGNTEVCDGNEIK